MCTHVTRKCVNLLILFIQTIEWPNDGFGANTVYEWTIGKKRKLIIIYYSIETIHFIIEQIYAWHTHYTQYFLCHRENDSSYAYCKEKEWIQTQNPKNERSTHEINENKPSMSEWRCRFGIGSSVSDTILFVYFIRYSVHSIYAIETQSNRVKREIQFSWPRSAVPTVKPKSFLCKPIDNFGFVAGGVSEERDIDSNKMDRISFLLVQSHILSVFLHQIKSQFIRCTHFLLRLQPLYCMLIVKIWFGM